MGAANLLTSAAAKRYEAVPVSFAGERTALNFVGRLSGIATLTAQVTKLYGRKPLWIVVTGASTYSDGNVTSKTVAAGDSPPSRWPLGKPQLA